MQKIGAQYVAKKIKDQLLAPPAPRPEPVAPTEVADAVDSEHDLDGQLIHDDEGQVVGRAVRLPGVAVYVISDGYQNRFAELERCLAEPDSRLLFRTDGARITSLIYVPDPTRAPARVEGTRSDDV